MFDNIRRSLVRILSYIAPSYDMTTRDAAFLEQEEVRQMREVRERLERVREQLAVIDRRWPS